MAAAESKIKQSDCGQRSHWLKGRVNFVFVFIFVQCCTFAVAVLLMRQFLKVNPTLRL